MSNPELMRMRSLSEEEFTLRYVIPLLRDMGFRGVEYTHGTDEYGRDVYFYEIDRFGNRRDMAAQVKTGDIGGTTLVQTIIAQARAAFTNPYTDISIREERRVCELYIITSGNISTNAKVQIMNGLPEYGGSIRFLNGEKLLEYARRVHSEILEFSLWETRIRELGLYDLLKEDDFKNDINEVLELLFNEWGKSPLQAVNELPKLLMGLPRVRARVQSLEPRQRDSLLHWYSVLILMKAFHVYGRNKKFVIG